MLLLLFICDEAIISRRAVYQIPADDDFISVYV